MDREDLEVEMISLMLEGKTNREVADALGLKHQTVKNYTSRLYKRFGVKDRIEFLLKFLVDEDVK